MPEEAARQNVPRIIARTPAGAVALVVLLALVAAVGWNNTLTDFRLIGWHQAMMEGAATAPDQYRMLAPTLAEAVVTDTPPATVEEAAVALQRAYFVVNMIAFIVTGLFFTAFCREWLSLTGALAGCGLLMAVAGAANLRGQIHVADPMNLMFVTIGLWAIQRGITWPLVAAMVVGAVNRESVLVLLGYFVLMQWTRPKRFVLPTALLLIVAWGAAYGALRMGYGARAYSTDVIMLRYNVEHILRWAPPLLIMIPLLLAAVQRPVAEWPGPLRRATLLIPPYMLLHFTIARLEEVRLFLPLLVVLIPLAVGGVDWADERRSITDSDAL